MYLGAEVEYFSFCTKFVMRVQRIRGGVQTSHGHGVKHTGLHIEETQRLQVQAGPGP